MCHSERSEKDGERCERDIEGGGGRGIQSRDRHRERENKMVRDVREKQETWREM